MVRKSSVKRVCLAYSGGLDTSVILRWLIEEYDCEVVAYCADVGQEEELDGLPDKAKASGAVDCIIRDVREEFVREYVYPAIRGGAVYEGTYLLGTALARPVIAKHHVEVARATGCDAVAHGATGKGNDQVRFELTFRALAPELDVIAPWRDWDLRSRTDCMAYAQKHGIPVTATVKKPYSIDRNLLHVSYEGGILEDPWRAPEEDMFLTTTSPDEAPDTAAEIILGLESITLDREVMHERDRLMPRFAELIYNGFWFSPEMDFLRTAIDGSQQNVTGEARLRLYKGGLQVTGRRSPVSLYSEALSSFEDAGEADTYRQGDATGFIALQGLRLPKVEES
jgi:argininosuccinate synthase